MDVGPLHDRIIVRRDEEGEPQRGGIIIPDTAKDLILFGKYGGQEVTLDGEEFLIMREHDVLAVIETG